MTNTHDELPWFSSCLENKVLIEKLKKIKLAVTDVDGCLTNGKAYISEDDNEHKGFDIQDGFIIKYARKQGIHIAFLSGRDNNSTKIRGKKLGLDENHCLVGHSNGKQAALRKLQQLDNVTAEQTLFLGDDVLDIAIKESVGLFVSPANGLFYVRAAADLVVPLQGGSGAFRLLVDLIMYVQGCHPVQELIDKALRNN